MPRPLLVLVTGPAGSGKTTLAARLATDLGCPLVSRDAIKEGMVATVGSGFVPSANDPLTLRTYGVFFEVIRVLLAAEVSLVAEAAFQHPLWTRGLRPLLGQAELRVVRCHADDARDRAARRLDTDPRRAAHADADHLMVATGFEELRLDAAALDVTTSEGYAPPYADVLGFCRDRS